MADGKMVCNVLIKNLNVEYITSKCNHRNWIIESVFVDTVFGDGGIILKCNQEGCDAKIGISPIENYPIEILGGIRDLVLGVKNGRA